MFFWGGKHMLVENCPFYKSVEPLANQQKAKNKTHIWLFFYKLTFITCRAVISCGWFSSAAQSCLTLCDPMDCSTPGFPVHHQLLEFTQTHVHLVSDTIQPSHLLSFPSPPAFNLSQHQGLFKWISSWHQVAKVLEFQLQHRSFQRLFKTDFLSDWLDSQESPLTPQFKSIKSLALSFHYRPTLTSIHDYWKNQSFD